MDEQQKELYNQLIDILDRYTTKNINVNDIPFMTIRSTLQKIYPDKEFNTNLVAKTIVEYHTKIKPMAIRDMHNMAKSLGVEVNLSELIRAECVDKLSKIINIL